jgi:hypothetical protein
MFRINKIQKTTTAVLLHYIITAANTDHTIYIIEMAQVLLKYSNKTIKQ